LGVSAGAVPGNGYVDVFDRGIFKVAGKICSEWAGSVSEVRTILNQ